MTAGLGQMSREQWQSLALAYTSGNVVTCPGCGRTGEALLKPMDRLVEFTCGEAMEVPETTTY